MTYFHDQIRKIKGQEFVSIIKTTHTGKVVTLKLVDYSDETVRLLLEWRTKYWNWFPTKFKGTEVETRKWIKEQILENPEKILFMIIFDGKKIGHLGLDIYNKEENSIDFWNFIRGVRGFAPGLMEHIEKIFIKWIFNELKISKIQLKVFSENYKTINLHEKCGLLTINSIPMKRIFTEDGWKWVETELKSETEYAERYLNIMEIKKDT